MKQNSNCRLDEMTSNRFEMTLCIGRFGATKQESIEAIAHLPQICDRSQVQR
jgi:hypothetical protein